MSAASDIAFHKADILAQKVYKETKEFPRDELFGMTSQLRRAVLSVPLNIIEGYARQSKGDYRRFLEIAYGSLKETKYLLYFSSQIGYLSSESYKHLIFLCEEIGKLLWSKIKRMNR